MEKWQNYKNKAKKHLKCSEISKKESSDKRNTLRITAKNYQN